MDHVRHSGIFNIPNNFSVTIIGAGGIGAAAALGLAKMGVPTMVVYDDDHVGPENLPTQLHRISDVGIDKVTSLGTTLAMFTDELEFYPRPVRVGEAEVLRSTLIISAVDSIGSRQAIWQSIVENGHWSFYLDSRMAAEEYQHFLVSHGDVRALAAYNDHLMAMDESSAPDLACTMKATFYTALTAAGHIGAQVRNIVRGEATSHRLVHNITNNFLGAYPIA